MDRRQFTTLALLAAGGLLPGQAAEADELNAESAPRPRPNAPIPTLGGRQFWADELFFHDWHIQRNTLTGHCRLLDGANVRQAWGSYEACLARLEQIKHKHGLPPMSGPAVVVLHGLFRSSASMRYMSRFLRDQGHYSVFNVSYPTTQGAVADHAQSLAKVMRNLEGITEINFVAHSLGNLVVRHFLADHFDPRTGIQGDARLRRMVMLGPPNQGAQMAEAFADVRLFHLMAGASASQLSRDWENLQARLTTPRCEFAILAGGRGTDKGYNPLLGEDNDMVVSVESTRLPGAADFAVLPVLHTFMMDDPRVQQYTLRFLQQGFFVSEAERHAIAADTSGAGS
ncbi:MAG TPA: alpha/beta fold hydrolase [Pirellulales bacterium]|jgi:pimeloyl-ACP methyl ester carboxylesterase|nr:alpha/beta fold hydrolase [Pirellulales bacterium]